MRIPSGFILPLALAVLGLMAQPSMVIAASNMAHAHMGHVTSSWKGTPGGKGLLPTAFAEARIASQHAGFAASKPGDLGWMKMHIRHVLNAIEPAVESKGPGLGYGVLKASRGVAKHIKFAAGSNGASKNVQAHALHVSTTANNTVARAQEILTQGKKVLTMDSASKAAPVVQRIKVLSEQLLTGTDANGDGNISWKKGEGGLNEAAKHMGFMAKGEGIE